MSAISAVGDDLRSSLLPEGKGYFSLLGQYSSFISAFNILQVCLTWYVFTSTHSAKDVGLVAIIETITVMVVSLPTGAYVDRVNKGMVLVMAGIVGVSVSVVLTLLGTSTAFRIIPVLILVVFWGASREFGRSAALSAIPEIVSEGSLSSFNGANRASSNTLGAISNALAGALIAAFGVVSGFIAGIGLYVISALFAALGIAPVLSGKGKRVKSEKSMARELGEAFRWLYGKKGFFLLTISATFFNFFLVMIEAYLVIFVYSGLKSSSLIFGGLLGAFSFGDVCGSIFSGKYNLLRHTGKINVVLYGGVPGACILLTGILRLPIPSLFLFFIWGFAIGIAINLWLTSAHNLVPAEMRGRYFALDGLLASISPVSIAVGAILISRLGIIQTFLIAGVMLLVFSFVFAFSRSLWHLDGSKISPVEEIEL